MARSIFHVALERRLQELIGEYSESIIDGHLPDYAEYKRSTSYVLALKHVILICDEIEKELSGDGSRDPSPGG